MWSQFVFLIKNMQINTKQVSKTKGLATIREPKSSKLTLFESGKLHKNWNVYEISVESRKYNFMKSSRTKMSSHYKSSQNQWFEKFLLGKSLFLYSDCSQNWYGGSLGEYPETFFLFFENLVLKKSCGLSKIPPPPIFGDFHQQRPYEND